MLAVGVTAIGVIGGVRLARRDRVGGVLTTVTSLAQFGSVLVGLGIDTQRLPLPYLGPIMTAIWVLPIAWQVARANQRQAERLVATESRYRAIFDQTFQFTGLLDVEGTLLEVNRTALNFVGVGAEDVIGKPFWETPWWTHSPPLQEKLREAIRTAAGGEVVRFEVTHPARDGQMHYIDFSLKPVYDDAAGQVILLIPEGRDITNRVVAEDAKRKLEQQLRAGAEDGSAWPTGRWHRPRLQQPADRDRRPHRDAAARQERWPWEPRSRADSPGERARRIDDTTAPRVQPAICARTQGDQPQYRCGADGNPAAAFDWRAHRAGGSRRRGRASGQSRSRSAQSRPAQHGDQRPRRHAGRRHTGDRDTEHRFAGRGDERSATTPVRPPTCCCR